MRKFVLLLSLMLVSASLAQTTKEKIQDTSKNIKTTQQKQDELNKKINDLAQQIVDEKKLVKDRQKEIDELTGLVINLQEKHQGEEKELEKLNSQNIVLINSKNDMEGKIVKIITDDLAFDIVQDKTDAKSANSIIATELFESLNKITSDELDKIIKDYDKTSSLILEQNKKMETIKKNLKEYNEKKTKLSDAQQKQKLTIVSLAKNKDEYGKRLEKLNNEQEEMRKTLENLKIIDDKEDRVKAKQNEQKRLAKEKAKKQKDQKGKKTQETTIEQDEQDIIDDARVASVNEKVKQYGSSYQASRIKKYSGPKTVAPLEQAFIKRKFGNYTDPVYNIKIFNESVVLGSKSSNLQVKSVLPGRVVFAKETAVLNMVVILEHSNGIHTIYAHMNQIAPTIKVGSTIKKGYVIGRVSEDLTFEVTQKNYHIDPLDLITLK